MDLDLKQWLDDGNYLPEPLKDFHDQKRVFQRLDEMVGRRDWPNGSPDWMTCQLFTIDVFLWFMASHGYTLQKSRLPHDRRPPFCDLGTTMEDYERRRMDAFAEMLKNRPR